MNKNVALFRIFGNNLKKFRDQRGLSQRALFSLCGIDNGTISRMENGQLNVTLATIATLADSLDVSCWELLFSTDGEQVLQDNSHQSNRC